MWLEGSFLNTGFGKMVEMLDVELIKNAHWSIHDNAAWVAPGSLVANGDFAAGNTGWTVGAGWSTATGKAVHAAAGGTVALSQALTGKDNYYYDITFTVSGRTAGTVTLSGSSMTGATLAVSADGTYTVRVITTGTSPTLTFTPTTTFGGAIDDVAFIQYGTNATCHVYKCEDAAVNCLFYLKVEDYHGGFSVLQLWEGWDAATHAGVGLTRQAFTGVYCFLWQRPTGVYKISLHDHHFVLIVSVSGFGGYFCGRPSLFDESKNIVMIVSDGTVLSSYNNLAYFGNLASGGWSFLFDENGNSNNARDGGGGAGTFCTYRYLKGCDGKYHISEALIENTANGLLAGTLPGVAGSTDISNGLLAGDIVTIDGVDWLNLTAGGYYSLVRKD